MSVFWETFCNKLLLKSYKYMCKSCFSYPVKLFITLTLLRSGTPNETLTIPKTLSVVLLWLTFSVNVLHEINVTPFCLNLTYPKSYYWPSSFEERRLCWEWGFSSERSHLNSNWNPRLMISFKLFYVDESLVCVG